MNETIEIEEQPDGKRWLSKWNKKIIHLFLYSDIKNPKLWPELRQVKKEIEKNFDWSNIKSEYINRLFRAYDRIGKDIFVPSHLKKHIPKFDALIEYDDKTRKINLHDYIIILKDIRSSLTYLKQLQSEIQTAIAYDPNEQIFTEWQKSMTTEKHNQYVWLHKEKINSEIADIQKKISWWTFTLVDIVQLYVFSKSLDKKAKFSFKDHLTPQHMKQEFVIGDLYITLKDFIRILKDLHIADHKLN